MTPELTAVLAIVLALIGTTGIVVPVLPGSVSIAAALLVWAVWGGSPWGWVACAIGMTLVATGAASGWFLTGRTLKRREIPQWPVVVGLIAGVIGLFLLPGLGFIIGFVAGVLLSELVRVRDLKVALDTSWSMVKAVGVGVLVELACGLLACSVLAASIITRFVFV